MSKENLTATIFKITSRITDRFPRFGAKLLNGLVFIFAGNSLFSKIIFRKNLHILRRVKKFDKICVLPDTNIGDAIFVQALVSALRVFFPKSQIDCVVNAKAEKLLIGNPEISNLFPIFSATNHLLSKDDLEKINKLLDSSAYDFVFNFCPHLSSKNVDFFKKHKAINYTGLIMLVIKGLMNEKSTDHITYQTFQFMYNLLSGVKAPEKIHKFECGYIIVSSAAIEQAKVFMDNFGFIPRRPKIFFQPDSSSRFTRIPFDAQILLLEKLLEMPYEILLGFGVDQKGIENRLLNSLPPEKRNKIKVFSEFAAVDVYAAIIDYFDVMITADTGPMHLAAAHRFSQSNDFEFRNRTAVFSVFGATQARIYGYDSHQIGFFPASQNAPSYAYVAESPCRNMTCIHKVLKTCKRVRCFENLDVKKIISDARLYLESIRK